jgi:hypothetical protein
MTIHQIIINTAAMTSAYIEDEESITPISIVYLHCVVTANKKTTPPNVEYTTNHVESRTCTS